MARKVKKMLPQARPGPTSLSKPPRTPLLRDPATFTNARGHLCFARRFPRAPPCEQPLETQLSSAIAQNGVEGRFG